MLNGAICYDFTTDALLALTDDRIFSIILDTLTYFLGSTLVVTDDTYSRLTEGRKLRG